VENKRSVRVRISGRVQGVGFRAWTERRANALGLSGWARNLANGDVEAVFYGPSEAVEAMLAACREGPRLAQVERVDLLGPAEKFAGPFRTRADG
jgi:acylphosphatase